MCFCCRSAWLCALNSSFCEIKLEKDDPRTSPMLSNYQEPSTTRQAQCYQEPSAKHQAQRTMPWKAQQSAIVALLQFLKNSERAEPPPLVK